MGHVFVQGRAAADMGAPVSAAAIRALLDARRQALHDRDAEAFLAIYAPDALIFDLAPPLAHGLDRRGVADWLASWDGPVASEIRDLRLTVAGDAAYASALERLAGRQGGEDRDIWFRLTLCLARGPEGWRVVHEHVSLPVRKTVALSAATDLIP